MKSLLVLVAMLFTTVHPYAQHTFNTSYKGTNLSRVAFPIGGMGAGMFCLDGTGSISHVSVRNNPEMFNEPVMFAALTVKGNQNVARVLEGPEPDWRKFGNRRSGDGAPGATYGLPRFQYASFTARFPFAEIKLSDPGVPVTVSITGWSPFVPTDADRSSLPVGALEYTFTNTTATKQELVFSYNAANFMAVGDSLDHIDSIKQGFVLSQDALPGKSQMRGQLAITCDDPATIVDHAWFRGSWYDPIAIAWQHIQHGETFPVSPLPSGAPGASLFVPFTLGPGQQKTLRVLLCWYVPHTQLHFGWAKEVSADHAKYGTHEPWYAGKFGNIHSLVDYWQTNYTALRRDTKLFTDAFYNSTLPPEVLEAVAANLTILKSPTVLRQRDGRFWGWEGCHDNQGSCPGSCTHVWNYAQALPHLFPAMERTLRETEFGENQNDSGHQSFRAMIPIRPMAHDFYAAADGQLGGIIKVYRDWRISGDSAWLRRLYPRVKASLDYCIRTWDPRRTGTLEEPHHNTYDIEFWGANGFSTSYYLGALSAFMRISAYLEEEHRDYQQLYDKGKRAMEGKLFNGEYFEQHIQWTGLSAPDPIEASKQSFGGGYSPEAIALLQKEGPKYQYGKGCLSDGVVGTWLAGVCGLPLPVDSAKIKSHLLSVYHYNFKKDLSTFSNPQRSTYAFGKEGGLLLCTWPRGGQLSLPFVYSNEVWTGIEYQVASHLISMGEVQKGLEIVRTARARYDGRIRNPFDEYECGHWYARAMSSYALLEALTGVRYDAVSKTLYVHSQVGDFTSFLSTNTGFGNVTLKKGKASVKVAYGKIEVNKVIVTKTTERDFPKTNNE